MASKKYYYVVFRRMILCLGFFAIRTNLLFLGISSTYYRIFSGSKSFGMWQLSMVFLLNG